MLETIFFLSLCYRTFIDWNRSRIISPLSSISLVCILLFHIPNLYTGNVISSPLLSGTLTLIFLNIFNPKFFRKPFKIKIISPNKFILFFNILFVIHLLISLYMALTFILEYGFLGALVRNRLDDYLSNINSSSLLNSIWFLTSFFFYYRLSLLLNSKVKVAIIVIFTYIITIIYFANTRLSIFLPFIPLLGWYFFVNKYKIKKFSSFVIISFIILPFFLIYSNAARQGIEISDVNYQMSDFLIYQFDYNKYLNELELYYEKEELEYGYGWLLGSFVNFIPRSIYKDKPVTSFSNRLTNNITGAEASSNNPVRTYTIFGTGYSQFGFIGTIIETMFYVLIFSRLYYTSLSRQIPYFAFFISFYALLYFRGETPFVQLFFLWFVLLFIEKRISND